MDLLTLASSSSSTIISSSTHEPTPTTSFVLYSSNRNFMLRVLPSECRLTPYSYSRTCSAKPGELYETKQHTQPTTIRYTHVMVLGVGTWRNDRFLRFTLSDALRLLHSGAVLHSVSCGGISCLVAQIELLVVYTWYILSPIFCFFAKISAFISNEKKVSTAGAICILRRWIHPID